MKGTTFTERSLTNITCDDIYKILLSFKDEDALYITIDLNGMSSDKMLCIFTHMKEFDLKITILRIYFYGATKIVDKTDDKTAFDHLIEYLKEENVLTRFTSDFYCSSSYSDKLINVLAYKLALKHIVLQGEFYLFINSQSEKLYWLLKHSYITRCNIEFSYYVENYMKENPLGMMHIRSVRDNTRLLCAVPIEDRDVPLITNTKSASKIT